MKPADRYAANVRAALSELWAALPAALFVLLVALIAADAFGN
jgi:hypothetical protein